MLQSAMRSNQQIRDTQPKQMPAHRRMRPVLHLDPVPRPASLIGPVVGASTPSLQGRNLHALREVSGEWLLKFRVCLNELSWE
jgi:hypothetical protein